MAFNGFEQLEWIVPEPRQAFEDVTAEILISSGRALRRIKVNRGDGGVDVYCGTFGEEGAADVYQAKYFPKPPWTSSQKQQIRDSYETARRCPDFNLSSWHLCIPSRPTKEDVRWFDEWARSLDVSATLIDGDDLVRILKQPRSGLARKMLRDWGIVGIESDGAIMEADLQIDAVTEKKSGLTHVFNVFLRNVGGRSADDLRISINHSETACVAWLADDHRWVDIGHGTLNPRSLAARESIHPGENILALAIPIVQATLFPFVVAIKAWIRDGEPREQHLIVEAPSLRAGELRPFAPGRGPDIRPPCEVIPDPVLAYPEDEMAEALLSLIARHPKPDEYGITEILAGDPADLTRALYMPSLARGGDTCGMDVALFQQAFDWLVTTGWLEPAGQNSKIRRYRLSAHARGDRRFRELVDRETASIE